MRTNEELDAYLVATGAVTRPAVKKAFLAADRRCFVPSGGRGVCYEDHPLPIGGGQTISQPTTVARMLELLGVRPGQRVLDVGSGSGWTTALLAELVGEHGRVFGVERLPVLVQQGTRNIAGWRNASISQATALGLPGEAPFDRILVSAAAGELPRELVGQLREGGVIVLPIKNSVWRVTRQADGLGKEEYPGYVFVPLR